MTAPNWQPAHAGGCSKRSFNSRAQALLELDRIRAEIARPLRASLGKKAKRYARARRTHPDGPTRVYVCPNCGQWHLTSQELKS